MSEGISEAFSCAVDEQAADWFSRRAGEAWSIHEQQQLDAWLAAEPAHARAFADMALLWADFEHMPRPVLHSAVVVNVRPRRRWLPSHALAASLLLCALLVAPQNWFATQPLQALSVHSAPGEQRQVALQDGTRIDLNVDTRLQVRLYEDRREVELLAGEAFFAVAADPGRPFEVIAGQGRVRVLGTRFSVRRGNQHLGVAVESGRVALQPQAGKAQQAVLGNGDGVDFDYRSGTLRQVRLAGEEIASWRRGQLIFRDRPLAQLLDELSHYRRAPVELVGSSLATRRVSGSLNIANPDAFLAALPQLLPVRVEQLGDGRALIHPR